MIITLLHVKRIERACLVERRKAQPAHCDVAGLLSALAQPRGQLTYRGALGLGRADAAISSTRAEARAKKPHTPDTKLVPRVDAGPTLLPLFSLILIFLHLTLRSPIRLQ